MSKLTENNAVEIAIKHGHQRVDELAFSKAELLAFTREIEGMVRREKPLLGSWRHNNGVICNGTLRIAREDFDIQPSDEYKKEILDWICATLNAQESAAGGVAGWQPIETAPKDGKTAIDLWFPKYGRRTNWRWFKAGKYWAAAELDRWNARESNHDDKPTHWMPLPEGPK